MQRDLCARIVGSVAAGPARISSLVDGHPVLLRNLDVLPLTGFSTKKTKE
jgi:hypothetical protein